ncbi:hypothetical protein NHX12_011573 [Muraenolepis orangiensis]|uniref:HAT C-terminal dimerisation domain-containing protein n=1 Tax=Muraenolepis orangiensis TaxID=630683 RepID=A0A9Q0I6U4_9TELE|nr:hypothetical protein NHX12_011573 [Muraenolepis orangiensis]
MAVLNPDNWDHDNPRFGDNEVRALCDVLHVNQQEAHLGFTEYKASGGRNIPNTMKKLLMAVDTLSPSNADCERGFSTMNNIRTEYRSKLTTTNAANLLFISSVGPPCRQWDPLPYVKTWLGKMKKSSPVNKLHGSPNLLPHNFPLIYLLLCFSLLTNPFSSGVSAGAAPMLLTVQSASFNVRLCALMMNAGSSTPLSDGRLRGQGPEDQPRSEKPMDGLIEVLLGVLALHGWFSLEYWLSMDGSPWSTGSPWMVLLGVLALNGWFSLDYWLSMDGSP